MYAGITDQAMTLQQCKQSWEKYWHMQTYGMASEDINRIAFTHTLNYSSSVDGHAAMQ